MKFHILAVRDGAADCFSPPFFMGALGTAIRSFADVVNDSTSKDMISKHPADFDLYELGFWDDSHSIFELLERPRRVAVGKDLVRPPRE